MYGLAGGSFTVTDAADACGGDSPHPVAASAVAITIKNLKAPSFELASCHRRFLRVC